MTDPASRRLLLPLGHPGDFASCFASLRCGRAADSPAQGQVESSASPRPRGTGGSATSPCCSSEPAVLLAVRAANVQLGQSTTGRDGECACSMMPLNSRYFFCFNPV